MWANFKAWFRDVVDKALTLPEANSRLAYLISTLVTSILLITHATFYVCAKMKDPNYTTILTILLGSHATNSFGRFLTKKGDGAQDDAKDDKPQS